jgi:hypothetical protein
MRAVSTETQDTSKRDGRVVARCRIDLDVADNSYAVCSVRAPDKIELLRYTLDFVGSDTGMISFEERWTGRTLVHAAEMVSSPRTIGFPTRGMGRDGHRPCSSAST